MTAYIVFIKEAVIDQSELDEYKKLVGPSFAGHDMTIRAAYGPHEILEGPSAEGVVMIEFADMDAAREWYRGPAYQTAAAHRFKGATYRAILFEGVKGL